MVVKPAKYDIEQQFTILETELSKFGKKVMTKPLRVIQTPTTLD